MVAARINAPTTEEIEFAKCALSPAYFVHTYCWIYDTDSGSNAWIPFHLWTEQIEVLRAIHELQKVIVLKARQLGLTWLCLAYALWQMIFKPIATILIFSKRDDEAVYLAGSERLRGMYDRLPDWMQAEAVTADDKHIFALSNGSSARAFPTTGGDGYTATFALIDEADLHTDLGGMLGRIKPTVDAGGKLVMISRTDKSKPLSKFKAIYRAAKAGLNEWKAFFLPWHVRPGRDQAWYEAQCREAMHNEASLDSVHEQYPATDIEALAPGSADKRIPRAWLDQCYVERLPLQNVPGAPDIADLRIYHAPEFGHTYGAGSDCAEGLPTSDDSTTYIVDDLGRECASFTGKLTPAIHAALTVRLAKWYNAMMMPENNNHGHAFVLWCTENGYGHMLAKGHDNKDGWTSNTKGKLLMYDAVAEDAKNGNLTVHDLETYTQLASIEKGTLLAPEGMLDDRADGFALARQASNMKPQKLQVQQAPSRLNERGW